MLGEHARGVYSPQWANSVQSNNSAADFEQLQAARACSPDSLYWAFRHEDGLNLQDEHEIEVRLDIDPQSLPDFLVPPGWSIAHTKPEDGIVFLRRMQPLSDEALKAMFAEILALAVRHQGRFQSWAHGSDLRDW
ncbi:MAG: hypothetical protein QM759_13795 [Terricaulis sp.]